MWHLTSDYLCHKFEICGVPFHNSGLSYGQQSASLVPSDPPPPKKKKKKKKKKHTLDRKYVITKYIQVAVK